MIKATEAAQNVINFTAARYSKVKEVVLAVAEEMSASIEFHSKNGINTIDFMPYTTSRFPSDYEMNLASDMFETLFEDNGYTVLQNDISLNSLKIKW